MSYLLDTNVLSETRKRRRDPGVTAWLDAAAPDSLYLSALTIGEIEQGAARLAGRGDSEQAAAIDAWLDRVLAAFDRRILPVTLQIARRWGRSAAARPVPVVDALLAATARIYDLTLVTRNTKDFEHADICTLNPFSGQS